MRRRWLALARTMLPAGALLLLSQPVLGESPEYGRHLVAIFVAGPR